MVTEWFSFVFSIEYLKMNLRCIFFVVLYESNILEISSDCL